MASTRKSEDLPRSRSLRVLWPASEFRRAVYANRVSVLTTSEGAAVITFGLQTTSGVLLDLVRVVLSPEGRLKQRESMVRFLERLGVAPPELPPLPPLPIQESLGVADEMVISTGQVSEAIFCGLSIAAISVGLVEEVPVQGLLRVQGAPALFSKLIRLLYLDEATTA